MYRSGEANLSSPIGAWPYLIPRNSKVPGLSGVRWPNMTPLVVLTIGHASIVVLSPFVASAHVNSAVMSFFENNTDFII